MLVIFVTLFGTPLLVCLIDGMKPGAIGFEYLTLLRGQTNIKQARTSYLGTGVARAPSCVGRNKLQRLTQARSRSLKSWRVKQ